MCVVVVEGFNIGWTTYHGSRGRLLKVQAMLVTAHGQSPDRGACTLFKHS